MTKEAQARIKINKPLEAAGWRFFEDASGTASIVLEAKVKCAIHRVWGESAKPA
jgi:type I restriction enzyme R subunit